MLHQQHGWMEALLGLGFDVIGDLWLKGAS